MGGRGAYRNYKTAVSPEKIKEELIKKDKEKTKKAINQFKQTMPEHNGIALQGDNFETGEMTVLRRSLTDIYEHSIEDKNIRKWLRDFKTDNLKEIDYQGWAHNRPYPKNHPKYDPENPTKSKHDNDTHYFLYYTIRINKRNYWVNVKMHKDYGEVIYTIEKRKPKDLIPGHKKK